MVTINKRLEKRQDRQQYIIFFTKPHAAFLWRKTNEIIFTSKPWSPPNLKFQSSAVKGFQIVSKKPLLF
ncbi:hypothetical protein NQ317_011042 [Molorchus minor]|uniref:Ribosomal protein L32 n=1 Tax=Molorchus minor TaxID=1323400 RepID=A0ABQ9IYV8_9CUCU|nr:hypothetical protein NQ317_011042 [Molorchus minor]